MNRYLPELNNDLSAIAAKFINNTSKNVFLTGKAGTGKTTFLKYIIKNTYKNAVITAPTGIAAINAGGVTLHSLFQLPFGAFVPDRNASSLFSENGRITTPSTLFKTLQLGARKRKIIQGLELLIIDEVSMLRADLLDAVDHVMRGVRKKNNLPFGGVQVLFIGDMLQLPPVVKDDEWQLLKQYYQTPFFFDAQVLRHHKPLYLELDKIYRQQDDTFIKLLNVLRTNQVSPSDLELLNSRYKPEFRAAPDDDYIYLTTHNVKADKLNRDSLNELSGKSYYFDASVTGEFNEYAFPVESRLELKKGAQVMFVKNDPSGAQRFFNGKIGIVSDIDESSVRVRFSDGSESVEVERYKWENIKYSINESNNEIEEHVAGSFEQYPIKLAWAITVHKSQGLTFDKAIVDVEGAFAPGQVYVALSRLTSLEGLILSSPVNLNSLNVDANISLYSSSKESVERLQEVLKEESFAFLKNYLVSCFDFSALSALLSRQLESFQREESRSSKQKYFEWTSELKTTFDEQKNIADKFVNQLHSIFKTAGDDYKKQLQIRILAAKNHFEPLLRQYLKNILKQIESLNSEKKVKGYIEELSELEASFFKQLQLLSKAEAMINSATANIEFSKESIHSDDINQEHKQVIETLQLASVPQKKQKVKTEKKERIDTKKISYDLYKEGKTVEQIAADRGMAESTIEVHLAHYVSLGLLDVQLFVEKEKMNNIISVSKTLDTTLFTPIKQALGDEYTYAEIKYAMAYYSNSKKE